MRKPLLLLAIPFCLLLSHKQAMSITLIKDNKPLAVIVVPQEANAKVQAAAQTLQEYLRRSTKATLPLMAQPGKSVAIHVGRSAYVDKLGLELEKLDADGFVLKGIDARNYVIAGPKDSGTEFGVYEFLERYAGVRWLMPTDIGTDVPVHHTLNVPATEVRQQPAFWSRELSPYSSSQPGDKSVTGERDTWSRFNRVHARIKMAHNLDHLFPPSKYAKTHPEFYPVLKGERYIPKDDNDYHWQPNFSAPGIVEEAVKNIKEYFRTHPNETSFSLGINDTPNFDESPESLARDNGKQNFLGMRDVSDSYFEWANAVVTEVLKEYPDKWFGMLAYFNVAEAPTRVPVHPRIIPYLTYDRVKWADPEIEKKGHEVTRRWAAAAPVVGWYDYIYGFSYMLPRVYPRQMQKYKSWGHDNQVRTVYAELYPNWGDGPKPWIFMKLLWDPKQNVDNLLNDWYRSAVGEKAAPLLNEYFAIWERFWTTTALKSKWFTPQGEFLAFYSPAYLADVKLADIQRCRKIMDEVVRRADTPQRKARAEFLRRTWDYYEASAYAYRAETLAQSVVTSESEALALLDSAPLMTMAQRRLDLLNKARDPKGPHAALDFNHQNPADYVGWRSDTWGKGLLLTALPWVNRSAKVKAKLHELTQSRAQVVSEQARFVLKIATNGAVSVTSNPSFEEGKNGWGMWGSEGEKGTFEIVDDILTAGKQGLVALGIKNGAPTQTVPLSTGSYYATARIFVPQAQQANGTFTVIVQGKDKDGGWLSDVRFERAVTPQPGKWLDIVMPFEITKEQGEIVKSAQLILSIRDFDGDKKLYLDEAGIFDLGSVKLAE